MNADGHKMEDGVETALRAEAVGLTPEFSEELHERIMHRIRAEARAGGAAPLLLIPRRKWPLLAAAAAVIVGGMIWAVAGFMNTRPTPPVAKAQVPSLPPVQKLIETAAAPARREMEDGKFGYLDRDAKRFAGYVLSQLPGRK